MKVITEQPESPECLGSVARFVWTHPWQVFVRRWNWKAAVLSAVFRGLLFGLTMTSLGGAGAARGIWVEIGFRILVGGFWGSLLQAFRAVRPAWVASMTVAVALPAAAHALEFAALRAAAAEHIGTGMAVSMIISAGSLLFNFGLMRKGLLVTDGGSSLWSDLAGIAAALVEVFRGIVRTFTL